MFICAHCPFVKYIESQIFTLSKEIENTVQTVAISSNDIVTHPSDSPENLRLQAQSQGWRFPYLYDENQNFAKELKAACTPDFYLFSNEGDGNFLLYYHGQLDDSNLSKGEIFLIKRSFLNVWKRIRHRRIQYPTSKNNTFS